MLLDFELVFRGVQFFSTPLHEAAKLGHVAAIKMLIDNGAQKDAVNSEQANALHLAARSGKLPAVRLLISLGLDPNARDNWGRTPLHHAIEEPRNLGIVNALIENGARVDERDAVGTGVLNLAAIANQAAIIATVIRYHGLNPNSDLQDEHSPLGWAIDYNSCLAEFTLLCAGAQLSEQEKENDELVSRSCLNTLRTESDKETMLQALAQESLAPWDPNIIDEVHSTPLITAVKKGCLRCVKFLLKDPRTNPNIQDNEKNTALHHLVKGLPKHGLRSLELCSRLLNLRRTNVGLKDRYGKTARHCIELSKQEGSVLHERCEKLFDLRKMRVQAYLSLKNARCSEQCSEKMCPHLPQLPADICFKIVGMLTEESLPENSK